MKSVFDVLAVVVAVIALMCSESFQRTMRGIGARWDEIMETISRPLAAGCALVLAYFLWRHTGPITAEDLGFTAVMTFACAIFTIFRTVSMLVRFTTATTDGKHDQSNRPHD